MSDLKDNKKPEECEGIRQARQTDKEIKEILKLLTIVSTESQVNKANLEHLSESYKHLATANSLTHYKLFSRTENLKVSMGKVETAHKEHVKHGSQETATGRYKHIILVSWCAIGVSFTVTIIFGLIQAGVFK